MVLVRKILAVLLVLAIGIAAVQPAGVASALAADPGLVMNHESAPLPGCDGCDPDQQAPMGCHVCAHFPPIGGGLRASQGRVLDFPSRDEPGHGRIILLDPHPPRTKPHP